MMLLWPGFSGASLPTPESVLGFEPCAPRKLATYEEIVVYLRALDQASDRMELVDIGKTAEGSTQWMAIISSEENLANLERYKEISARLARARDLEPEEARALADEGKAIVWIDFGLHSTEKAHAQTAPWMAYKAVSEESREMRTIRDNVIFLLLPNMNPDGTTLVVDWYRKNLDTPYEDSSPPELYQKYVGHDNNRDWFMFNQPETRNVGRQLYHEWYPQLIYNQHQEAPFPARIFIPPFEDPMNPNIPPLVMRGINLVGEAMSRRFDQEDKSGALSRVSFDTWWNGGMRTAPYYHNMIGILTETGHSTPRSLNYDASKFPKTFGTGISTTEPSTFYPNPFEGGEWHFRDSCEYMVTGSMAVLDIGARRRTEWLYDIYRMGRDAIAKGEDEAWVVPVEQWDAGVAAKLVNTMRHGGVEIERTTAPFLVGEREIAAGSYVIRGAQAFRPYVLDLLEPQVYPEQRLYPGGPLDLPYDITGWTLPMQMGVEVLKVTEGLEVSTEPVEEASPRALEISGKGEWGWAIDPRSNDAFTTVNRLIAAGHEVGRLASALQVSGVDWPPGAFAVRGSRAGGSQASGGDSASARELLERGARELGVPTVSLASEPESRIDPIGEPRIGMYRPWGGNMDEGWTRWLLEGFEFDFRSVRDEEIRRGELRSRLDVLVLPDSSYGRMLRGMDAGTMPTEYAGGMTPAGVYHLYQFVRDGGTLVALDSAAELPLTVFGLPLADVTDGRDSDSYFIPGTLLALTLDSEHPLAYGMPERAIAFFARSPAFRVGRRATRLERQRGIEPPPPPEIGIVARWAEEDLLASGWLLGESVIADQAAVVDARIGEGRLVLLGMRAQHRGQTHGTFKLLFNALLGSGMERPAAVEVKAPAP